VETYAQRTNKTANINYIIEENAVVENIMKHDRYDYMVYPHDLPQSMILILSEKQMFILKIQ